MTERRFLINELAFDGSEKKIWDAIIKKNKCHPRIVDYKNNYLDFFDLSKQYKTNNLKLFVSLNVGGLKLTELGYKDKWSKKPTNNKLIEQFEIILTNQQAKELYLDLKKRLEQ